MHLPVHKKYDVVSWQQMFSRLNAALWVCCRKLLHWIYECESLLLLVGVFACNKPFHLVNLNKKAICRRCTKANA